MKKHTYTIQAFVAAAILVLGAFTSGCQSVPTDNPASPTGDLNQDLAFEIFTKVGTSELLNGDKDQAQTIITVADLILGGISSGELAIPAQVDAAISELVLSTDLEPGSKQAILVLADTLAAHYLARLEAGQLDPSITAPLAAILGWVRSAAIDTLRYGAPQNYGAPAVPAEIRAEMGATETTLLAKLLSYIFVEWWRSRADGDDSRS